MCRYITMENPNAKPSVRRSIETCCCIKFSIYDLLYLNWAYQPTEPCFSFYLAVVWFDLICLAHNLLTHFSSARFVHSRGNLAKLNRYGLNTPLYLSACMCVCLCGGGVRALDCVYNSLELFSLCLKYWLSMAPAAYLVSQH